MVGMLQGSDHVTGQISMQGSFGANPMTTILNVVQQTSVHHRGRGRDGPERLRGLIIFLDRWASTFSALWGYAWSTKSRTMTFRQLKSPLWRSQVLCDHCTAWDVSAQSFYLGPKTTLTISIMIAFPIWNGTWSPCRIRTSTVYSSVQSTATQIADMQQVVTRIRWFIVR